MKTVEAKIIDQTHLELNHPISINPGSYIKVLILNSEKEEMLWKDKGKKQFLEAYDSQDSIYDTL